MTMRGIRDPAFPRSLERRAVFSLALGMAALLGFVTWFFFDHARDLLYQGLADNLTALAALGAQAIPADYVTRYAAERTAGGEPLFIAAALDDALGDILRSGEVSDAFLVDPSNRVLRDAGAGRPYGSEYYLLELHSERLDAAWTRGAVVTTPIYEDGAGVHHLAAFAPVADAADRPVALLGLEASVPALDVFDSLRTTFLAVALVAVLAAVAFAVLASRAIIRPVSQLADRMAATGDGGYPPPLPITRKDEIGYLAARFNRFLDELRERDRALRALSAGIAHEVRNPLAALRGNLDLLGRRAGTDPRSAEIAGAARAEIDALQRLVKDFLAYARPREAPPAPVPLGPTLTEARAEATAATGSDHAYRFEIPADLPPLAADPDELRRVFANLFRNAFEATPAGGSVRVRAEASGGTARITVRDDGPGIPKEARERIFEPFYTTRDEGTGLGLAISRRIARSYGGDIAAEDTPAGAGFIIEWPLWRTS